MHPSAMEYGRRFFSRYANAESKILEIGSLNVNGTLRDVAPVGAIYTGLDVQEGPGVDIVHKTPKLPFTPGLFDIVVSSSAFEHDPQFWETFVEALMVLKPSGLLYLNAPANGTFHQYPKDYWRFYPDAAEGLTLWATKFGYNPAILDSFVSPFSSDTYNDYVAVFLKDISAMTPELLSKRSLVYAV